MACREGTGWVEVTLRRLYHLTAGPEVRRQAAEWLATAARAAPVLWVGESRPADLPGVAPAQIGHWLGHEVQALVFEAEPSRAVDALVIAAGLLRRGGVLVLLDAGAGTGAFAQRWQAALAEPPVQELAQSSHPVLPPVPRYTPVDEVHWTQDQCAALSALEGLVDGECRVLVAPRGRGKSTVLGETLARLAADGTDRLTLTGPSRVAVQAALDRCRANGVATLEYSAPDALEAVDGSLGTLVIDEAAALPVERLVRLASRARRLILATTTGGFEGSGQGFRLRALPALEAAGFRVHMQTLETPVRWDPGDPLEAWFDRLFLLGAESTCPEPQAVRLRIRSGSDLAQKPVLLESVTGLLADAHYRTRPSDLIRWLEDPGIRLVALEGVRDGGLFGVALVQEEPGLTAELADAAWAGERRPQGHFLPCTLAALGAFGLARCGAWRVQRIAVHPRWQGRGLGRRLLRALMDQARTEGVALVGASFGLQPALLRLWQQAGFSLVRVGVRPDAASGQVSAVVLRALAPDLQTSLAGVAAAFRRDWPIWQGLVPSTTAAVVQTALDADTRGMAAPVPDAEADTAEVMAFARRSRPLEWALPALLRELDRYPPTDSDGVHLAEGLRAPPDGQDRRARIRHLRKAARAWLQARGR